MHQAGVGKTFFALNLAHAIATGGEFLGWKADKPRKVLFLDGEIAASDMQSSLDGTDKLTCFSWRSGVLLRFILIIRFKSGG